LHYSIDVLFLFCNVMKNVRAWTRTNVDASEHFSFRILLLQELMTC
jgi:hypothetical protein